MKSSISIVCLLLMIGIQHSCTAQNQVLVTSPDGQFRFELQIEDAQPYYRVYFENKEIIAQSRLGLAMKVDGTTSHQLTIKAVSKNKVDRIWKPLYGERGQYPEQYHQALISFSLEEKDLLLFNLNVRVYNEGVAFRYEFEKTGQTIIEEERTAFSLPEDAVLWVSDYAQAMIEKHHISELESSTPLERPLLAQLNDSLFLALGEAAFIDFARMKFVLDEIEPATFKADLHSQVIFEGSFRSPWRYIMAGKSAGELLENNYFLLNLNEPNAIKNPDWIKPGKVIREVTLTTQGGIACVDFAAQHNLQYIEFDAGWYGKESDDTSDATTITVDPERSRGPLDLHQVIQYADRKGIGVLLYINRRALERQLDEILPLVKSWGIKGLKYGFVNVGSQEWTSWLHHAVRKAADFELMVDIHDEYRPTGYSRTYPNLMTQEGIRGDETSPDNSMVLKTLFVRMLAGAGDHTICYFAERVDTKMGSHASQLAKSVCIYSPWQFLYWYDRPQGSPGKVGGAGDSEKYILEVPELTFFDQLPTVWDDTKVLEGTPGEYAVVARRNGTTWFVGALNGDHERDFTIALDFLDSSSMYEATVFTDREEVLTPTNVAIDTLAITSQDEIKYRIGKQKGMAMIIKKAN